MTAPKEMTVLRRLSRTGGFIARHWAYVLIGVGAVAVTYLAWKFVI